MAEQPFNMEVTGALDMQHKPYQTLFLYHFDLYMYGHPWISPADWPC